ncbi:hypothetical protein FHT08_000812 [Xanthomonas campestris]|uniref:hypothetical protein n=1 Tax=Xanthomonas sp. CFBP 8151 TaxID=3035310 RepID=UPI00141BBDA8|nr:hypothetical protein [Xanthomonas sp. CFBP 8151]NIJ75764.1 hypothetical protein [Xanthomonas sp. CFBP 8151]
MLILLTLFRSNVCWAKPNHAFFYCQQSFAFFFQHLVAMRPVEMPQRRCAMPRAAALRMRSCNGIFKKALLLCCFFFAMQTSAPLSAAPMERRTPSRRSAHRLSAS